jgi:hypothetical protein
MELWIEADMVYFKVILRHFTDRATAALSAKLVPTFPDRGCHVVSAMDPYGR